MSFQEAAESHRRAYEQLDSPDQVPRSGPILQAPGPRFK